MVQDHITGRRELRHNYSRTAQNARSPVLREMLHLSSQTGTFDAPSIRISFFDPFAIHPKDQSTVVRRGRMPPSETLLMESKTAQTQTQRPSDSINKVSEGGILPRPDYGRLVFRMNSERIEKRNADALGVKMCRLRERCSISEAQASVRSEPF